MYLFSLSCAYRCAGGLPCHCLPSAINPSSWVKGHIFPSHTFPSVPVLLIYCLCKSKCVPGAKDVLLTWSVNAFTALSHASWRYRLSKMLCALPQQPTDVEKWEMVKDKLSVETLSTDQCLCLHLCTVCVCLCLSRVTFKCVFRY